MCEIMSGWLLWRWTSANTSNYSQLYASNYALLPADSTPITERCPSTKFKLYPSHFVVHTIFVTFDVNFRESKREIRIQWLLDRQRTICVRWVIVWVVR